MCGELLVSQDDDLSHRDLPNFATALGLKMPLCLLDRPLSRQHPDRHAPVCEELGLSSDLLYALVSLDHWIAPVGCGQSWRGGGPLRQLALSYHARVAHLTDTAAAQHFPPLFVVVCSTSAL
jgi:hypothetical protein